MTSISSIQAGARLTAGMLRGVAPLAAYKSLDQSLTTNVGVPQNDNALLLSVDADAVYMFILQATYTGGTLGSSDLKTAWTVPAAATMTYGRLGYTTAGALAFAKTIQSDTPSFGTAGTGTNTLLLAGTVAVSSTSGTLQWMWSQNSGTATSTTVHAGSVLAAWQVQ